MKNALETLNSFKLWTALVTPMKDDGTVDYHSFEKTLRAQDEAKNGILILGSTGEALNIDEEERREIVRFTKNLKLKNPIMVGIGGQHLESQLSWIDYCETQKVDAYLMVTPIYAKPGRHGQTAWFRALLDRASKPCMLYNVPSRSGTSLNFDTVSDLTTHKNFWAIKEASGKTQDFARYVEVSKGRPVYSGDDAMLPDFAPLGCRGLVSVASNPWPKETHRYVELALASKLADVKLWQDSTNLLFVASNPVPAKVLMHKVGQLETPILRAPLCDKDMVRMDEVLAAHKNIQSWYQKNKA